MQYIVLRSRCTLGAVLRSFARLGLVACFALPLACARGGGGGDDIPPPADVAAPPADATVTDSGLAYKVLVEGTGDSPTLADDVTVHYTGWTTDGKMFDSSVARGEPSTFGVTQVIAGWTEGLQSMKEGGKHRLWIPEELAYRGQPGRPAGMLVFDVELLGIN
jgi:peptidylprolyl isomerase